MESIEKIIKAVRIEVANRFTNQYVVSFYFSALIINWQIVLIVFSKTLDTTAKINLIYYGKLNIWNLLIYPAIMATIYVVLSPATSFISNSIWAFARNRINQVLRHFEKDAYLPIDKSLKLRQEMYDADKKYLAMFQDVNEVRSEYKKEIEKMENQIRQGESKVSELNEIIANQKTELNGMQERSLVQADRFTAQMVERAAMVEELRKQLDQKSKEAQNLTSNMNRKLDIGDMESKVLRSLIQNSPVRAIDIQVGLPLQKTLYYLDKLSALNYVTSNGVSYSLTGSGRAFYYENLEKESKPVPPLLPPAVDIPPSKPA